MANNRLYLRCRGPCRVDDVDVFLAKQMGHGWYRKDERAVGDVIEEFMDEHFWCQSPSGDVRILFLNEGEDGAPRDGARHYEKAAADSRSYRDHSG